MTPTFPTEAAVLYEGTAALHPEPPRQARCPSCGTIIDPAIERQCITCEEGHQ